MQTPKQETDNFKSKSSYRDRQEAQSKVVPYARSPHPHSNHKVRFLQILFLNNDWLKPVWVKPVIWNWS